MASTQEDISERVGFYQKNLSVPNINQNMITKCKNQDSVSSTKKVKKEKKDCLNLKKTLLNSSPKLVLLKSAEDLCFDKGVKKSKKDPKIKNSFDPVSQEDRSSELLLNNHSTPTNIINRNLNARPTVQSDARKKPSHKGLYFLIFLSALISILAAFTLVWTPYDILMNERLKMVRGLPAYEWWKNPPDEVLLRVYLFNITNAPEFLSGQDQKLRMEEVGPFIFREKLSHSNVKFNDNGTMTYTAHRSAIFLPERNQISLNATLVLPNLAVLGMSSYLWNAAFFTKLGFNLLQNRLDSQPIMQVTVWNYLWNLTDPLLQVANNIVPHLVPEQNMGILYQIYNNFVDEVTVFMGPGNGRRFFTVDQFHGSSRFNFWGNETCDSVQGATEGVTYHQEITKNDTLLYLRKTICRVTPLNFKSEIHKLGMTAYKFELPEDIFSRPVDKTVEECFLQPGLPSLPSGLTDVSPCYYDFPIAASFPHFLNSAQEVLDSIDGLTPDPEKHGSFVIVEPTTGVPMESRARSQSNLVVRPLTFFPRVKRFSNLTIPMFWAEYNQVGLPWYIATLMYFTVVILPASQTYLSCLFLILGLFLLSTLVQHYVKIKKSKRPLHSYSSLDLIPSIASSNSEC